ncbi:MAG TPA: hypothetical protein VF265_00605 [Nevskiaceae bacterium]
MTATQPPTAASLFHGFSAAVNRRTACVSSRRARLRNGEFSFSTDSSDEHRLAPSSDGREAAYDSTSPLVIWEIHMRSTLLASALIAAALAFTGSAFAQENPSAAPAGDAPAASQAAPSAHHEKKATKKHVTKKHHETKKAHKRVKHEKKAAAAQH